MCTTLMRKKGKGGEGDTALGLRRGQFQILGEVEVVWEKDEMNCNVFLFQNTLQDEGKASTKQGPVDIMFPRA